MNEDATLAGRLKLSVSVHIYCQVARTRADLSPAFARPPAAMIHRRSVTSPGRWFLRRLHAALAFDFTPLFDPKSPPAPFAIATQHHLTAIPRRC